LCTKSCCGMLEVKGKEKTAAIRMPHGADRIDKTIRRSARGEPVDSQKKHGQLDAR